MVQLLVPVEFSGRQASVYNHVPHADIAEALIHLRELFKGERPADEAALRVKERREAGTRVLLSNLARMSRGPTLRTVLEVADLYSMTLDAAHELFGYDLSRFRELDYRLNGRWTRPIESYAFKRDTPIDLPAVLAPQAFTANSALKDLVVEWQTQIPIRVLDASTWGVSGAFYVQVGDEDSLGSGLPPRAVCLVEPVPSAAPVRPDPRKLYLLQFGNGYRCSRCVLSNGKLLLLASDKSYAGPQQFSYPHSVRIVGQIRMVAFDLPVREPVGRRWLNRATGSVPLILPWEQLTMEALFATEHRRFRRSSRESVRVREELEAVFQRRLTGRTERRYRTATRSEPHVDTILQLALANSTRYTDALRSGGNLTSDRGRYSLEVLLKARTMEGLLEGARTRAQVPQPADTWTARRLEFPEWPSLLSMRFPRPQACGGRIVRVADTSAPPGLNPPLAAGSLLLLEDQPTTPDPFLDGRGHGWSRPLYALRRGADLIFGPLERDGAHLALLFCKGSSETSILLEPHELPQLRRASGIAIPV